MTIGDRVKIIGPAFIETREDPSLHWYIRYGPWGTITDIHVHKVQVELDGMNEMRYYKLWYPAENILDFFTASCEDALNAGPR